MNAQDNDPMEALALLYRELDSELSRLGPLCSGCGRCCRFDEADHILYAGALERRYLAACAPAPGGDADPDLLARGLRCPFQAAGRCLAREARTLGCRLYHCVWPRDVDEEEVYRRWHERLQRLHDRFGVDWDYRPLFPL